MHRLDRLRQSITGHRACQHKVQQNHGLLWLPPREENVVTGPELNQESARTLAPSDRKKVVTAEPYVRNTTSVGTPSRSCDGKRPVVPM